MRARLAGRWRLVSYLAVPDEGEPFFPLGRGAKGVLDYSRGGNVSVHIMGAGYFAYYGYYTVNEKAATVTHHLELCSDRSLAGAVEPAQHRPGGRPAGAGRISEPRWPAAYDSGSLGTAG